MYQITIITYQGSTIKDFSTRQDLSREEAIVIVEDYLKAKKEQGWEITYFENAIHTTKDEFDVGFQISKMCDWHQTMEKK